MRFAILVCSAAAGWILPAEAQESQQPQTVELFEAAKSLEMIAPKFPPGPANRGEEGWVILNFMVDEKGKVFEPMVVDAMGDSVFVNAALQSLYESKFAPASVAGRPVASSTTMRYTFVLENGPNGARPGFVSEYRRLVAAVNADEQENAKAALEALEKDGAHSLYEDAYLNLARYFYAAKHGSSEEQMTHLAKALFFNDEKTYETYLPAEDAAKYWPQLFVLQARNGHFAEALATYDVITAIGAEEARASLAEAVTVFQKVAVDDTSYAVDGRTDANGSWNIILFKDQFYIDNLESKINEIKLRCDKKYVFFEFDADTQYTVPPELGQCQLEVLGDAGAKFRLVQS